jgi:hypothetical protein
VMGRGRRRRIEDMVKDRYARSDVQRGVSHILGLGGTRPARQKRAMQYSRDVLTAIVDEEW